MVGGVCSSSSGVSSSLRQPGNCCIKCCRSAALCCSRLLRAMQRVDVAAIERARENVDDVLVSDRRSAVSAPHAGSGRMRRVRSDAHHSLFPLGNFGSHRLHWIDNGRRDGICY